MIWIRTHAARGAAAWTVTLAVSAGALASARLTPEAIAGWHTYVAVVEARHATEARDPARFLGLDFRPDAESVRRDLVAGLLWIEPLEARQSGGRGVDVPGASVHHWVGAVFIAGIGADALVARLEAEPPGVGQEDVVAARVIERRQGFQRISLRLRQSSLVTVVLDTDHDVTFDRPAPGRARSASRATRIAEVEHAGRSDERVLQPGFDHGFLWRWQAYWRFRDVPGGVIAECESASLSRDVPAILRPMASPLIRRTARESMTRTLETLRRRFTR